MFITYRTGLYIGNNASPLSGKFTVQRHCYWYKRRILQLTYYTILTQHIEVHVKIRIDSYSRRTNLGGGFKDYDSSYLFSIILYSPYTYIVHKITKDYRVPRIGRSDSTPSPYRGDLYYRLVNFKTKQIVMLDIAWVYDHCLQL